MFFCESFRNEIVKDRGTKIEFLIRSYVRGTKTTKNFTIEHEDFTTSKNGLPPLCNIVALHLFFPALKLAIIPKLLVD